MKKGQITSPMMMMVLMLIVLGILIYLSYTGILQKGKAVVGTNECTALNGVCVTPGSPCPGGTVGRGCPSDNTPANKDKTVCCLPQ